MTKVRPKLIILTNVGEIDDMRLAIRDLVVDEVCAGAQPGRALLNELLNQIAHQPAQPEPLFLDFANVELATASFLRESVLALRTLLRGRKSTLYPVIANANDLVRDELEIVVSLAGDTFLSCDLESDGSVTKVELIGRLEEKQRRVFDVIEARGETDAGELQQEFGATEGVQQTAWNNRLSALAAAGLTIEISRGRAKRYRSLLQGD